MLKKLESQFLFRGQITYVYIKKKRGEKTGIKETPSVVTVWTLKRVIEGGLLCLELVGIGIPLAKVMEKQKKDLRCVSPEGN